MIYALPKRINYSVYYTLRKQLFKEKFFIWNIICIRKRGKIEKKIENYLDYHALIFVLLMVSYFPI